jgi:hypothetical protein
MRWTLTLEGEAGGEDVGVVVGVESGGGDLEAGAEDDGEAVAGGVAQVELTDHEAGGDEGLGLPVVGTLVVVVRVDFDFGPEDFAEAVLGGGIPGDGAADGGGFAGREDGAEGGLDGEGAEAFAAHEGRRDGGDEGAVFVAAGGEGEDCLAAEGVVVLLVGAGEGAELDGGGEVPGAVFDFGVVVVDVGGEIDIDFGVGEGDEVEALGVVVDIGGGAGRGVLMEIVEAEELDHLGGGRDDGDGEGGLFGERGADAVFPGGEEVGVGGGGLGEGGGGKKDEEAEGERAADVGEHADFLAEDSRVVGRKLIRYGAGELNLSCWLSVGNASALEHRSHEGLGYPSMGGGGS